MTVKEEDFGFNHYCSACLQFYSYYCAFTKIIVIKERKMYKYNELIAQIREAVEMKETSNPIDYTTDLFVRDVIENDMEDWEAILKDLSNQIDSAIVEINNQLNSGWVFEEKSDMKESEIDEFDPFQFESFPYTYKTPDDRSVVINGKDDADLIKEQLPIFERLRWLDSQKNRIEKCIMYFNESKGEKPFRTGRGLPTIPFHGNQSRFIAIINLLINGGFIPLRGKDPKKDLKNLGLPINVLGDYESFFGLHAKDIAFLFADYFHSVVISEKLNESGIREKNREEAIHAVNFKKQNIWYKYK